MIISGIQVGILMGIGVLSDALSDAETDSEEEEVESGSNVSEMEGGSESSEGIKEKSKREAEEVRMWINEGEAFVDDLEVLREVIGERYSSVGKRRRIRRKRAAREKEEQCWEEKNTI